MASVATTMVLPRRRRLSPPVLWRSTHESYVPIATVTPGSTPMAAAASAASGPAAASGSSAPGIGSGGSSPGRT